MVSLEGCLPGGELPWCKDGPEVGIQLSPPHPQRLPLISAHMLAEGSIEAGVVHGIVSVMPSVLSFLELIPDQLQSSSLELLDGWRLPPSLPPFPLSRGSCCRPATHVNNFQSSKTSLVATSSTPNNCPGRHRLRPETMKNYPTPTARYCAIEPGRLEKRVGQGGSKIFSADKAKTADCNESVQPRMKHVSTRKHETCHEKMC